MDSHQHQELRRNLTQKGASGSATNSKKMSEGSAPNFWSPVSSAKNGSEKEKTETVTVCLECQEVIVKTATEENEGKLQGEEDKNRRHRVTKSLIFN